MKNILSVCFVLLGVVVFASCEKVEVDTTYRIYPMVENFDKDTLAASEYAGQMAAYLYFDDTSTWSFGDFEEISRGILRRSDGSAVGPDITGTVNSDGSISVGPITEEVFAILCCYTDPDYQTYAWRNSKTLENLPEIGVKARFCLWQTKEVYQESGWTFFYKNYYVPQGSGEPGGDSGPSGRRL